MLKFAADRIIEKDMRITRAIFLCLFVLVMGLTVIAQQEIPRDLEISLQRSTCYGWCPSYSLTIHGDGAVKFTPLSPFVYIGRGETPKFPLEGKISADQLLVLLSEFEKIRFYSLSRRYGSDEYKRSANCPRVETDASSAEVTIAKDGKRKTVSHYLGCSGSQILKDLTALENKIDEIANTKQWSTQFGWGGTANVVDLKLEVGPAKPKVPKNPDN